MADRKAGEAAIAVPQEHRVTDIAGRDCSDLGAQIEPGIEFIAQLAGRAFHLRALASRQLGIPRRPCVAGRLGRLSHDRGQKTRMESELAVQPDMLGALRKREKTGVADAPALERIAGCRDEKLADAGVPQIGPRRQRPEKPDAAPMGRKVRAEQRAIPLGREGCDVFRTEARLGVRRKAESLEIGYAEKRAESVPDDALSLRQIALGQGANSDHECSRRVLTPRML